MAAHLSLAGQAPAHPASGTAAWTGRTNANSRLGHWELSTLIGEGAFCRVFAARPAGAATRPHSYAVKLLKEQWHDQPAAVATLVREAEALRLVRSAHVATVLEAQISRPPYCLVMPRYEGRTLAEMLRAGRLTLAQSLWYARQTAEALAALERADWMHGDVKPTNVIIGPDGHATLVDLGFARRTRQGTADLDRTVLGSIHYMAPETIVSRLRSDIRSDLYSLGVMLYQMLTGRLPFEGTDVGELMRAHRQQRPRRLRSLAPEVPSGVTALVDHMLSKEPLRRPQSAAAVVQRLAGFEIDCLVCR